MEYDLEDITDSNSEIRYLTLELMKLAKEKGISFEKVVEEYIHNVIYLRDKIESINNAVSDKPKKEPTYE